MTATARHHATQAAAAYPLDAYEGRALTVHLTRATERRLVAMIDRCNAEDPGCPMDASSDEDLAIALTGCADRGLRAGETDDRVWTDLAGVEHPLPRARRSPLRMRCRFAARAAITTWRST